jgi:hypothetical protein
MIKRKGAYTNTNTTVHICTTLQEKDALQVQQEVIIPHAVIVEAEANEVLGVGGNLQSIGSLKLTIDSEGVSLVRRGLLLEPHLHHFLIHFFPITHPKRTGLQGWRGTRESQAGYRERHPGGTKCRLEPIGRLPITNLNVGDHHEDIERLGNVIQARHDGVHVGVHVGQSHGWIVGEERVEECVDTIHHDETEILEEGGGRGFQPLQGTPGDVKQVVNLVDGAHTNLGQDIMVSSRSGGVLSFGNIHEI